MFSASPYVRLGLLVGSLGLLACSMTADPGADGDAPSVFGKGDGHSLGDAFPAPGDLALVIPMEDARIEAESVMPDGWLDAVDASLADSELAEHISDESWAEDWRLVSGRFLVCSSLGRVADREEVDRLCWPQVRLVFQPILEDLRVNVTIRPWYADDRAIHALYRVAPDAPELAQMLAHLGSGGRLADVDPTTLAAFERARDEAGRSLLAELASLREHSSGYGEIEVRPELATGDATPFLTRLLASLQRFCPPEALHELTAFSLPNGRNPAGANLWSFVAFEGHGGELRRAPLGIFHPEDGSLLFAFEHSEDVTTDVGDGELEDAWASLSAEAQSALREQVIMDISDVPALAPRINDPYQTLVPNTSCASCHRMTHLDFNFHNFSYFEDHGFSIAPRVRLDVQRDVTLARALWARN